MIYDRADLEEFMTQMEKRYNLVISELQKCPEGKLMQAINGRKNSFFQVTKPNGSNGKKQRKTINRRPDLINGLARKMYLQAECSRLETNIGAMGHFLAKYQEVTPAAILKTIPEKYRALPEAYFFITPAERYKAAELTGIRALPAVMDPSRISNEPNSPNDSNDPNNPNNPNEPNLRNPQIQERTENRENTAFSSGRSEAQKRAAQEWAHRPYEQSTYYPEKKKNITSFGLRVRSKSELLIAEMLQAYGLPLRYEEVLHLGHYNFSPDFKILAPEIPEHIIENVNAPTDRRFCGSIKDCHAQAVAPLTQTSTQTPENSILKSPVPGYTLFYWEHCGMMEDENYRKQNKWKLELYEKAGIVPWKNLIITYDRGDGSINLAAIKAEIETKLLMRR